MYAAIMRVNNTTMSKENLSGLTVNDIKERLAGEEDSLKKLRFAHAVSPIENPMKIREARKRIARLKTELTKRNNQEAEA